MAKSGIKELTDCVQYRLFPVYRGTTSEEVICSLNDYITKCYSYLSTDLSQYVWNFEPFNLKAIYSDKGVHYIEGITNFGDNIEDEWFIVYLLYRLTTFDKSLVIQLEDIDGEFLLIEAADYLPKWVEPDTTENRVFLANSSLHLIPIKRGPLPSGTPDIKAAVDAIRVFPDITRCDEQIQKSIAKRIDVYPQRITEFKHMAHCYVPIGVAALLKHDPSLVSIAVRAFYYRTPDDLKVCQAMKYFPPENRVMRCVTLTRCLYAQLIAQPYKPDIKVGWNLPPINSSSFKAHDLGVKLASGFEILISNYNDSSDSNSIDNDCRWQQFCDSLKKYGYYGEEVIGSQKHNLLTNKAKEYFYQMIRVDDSQDLGFMRNCATKASNYLKTLDIDHNAFKKEEASLDKEDSDEWLSFSADEFEALLKEKFSGDNTERENYSKFSTQIPASINEFVSNEKSGLKGAEIRKNTKHAKVSLNEDTFGDAINNILAFKVPIDESGSSSGMSDYDSDSEDSLDSDDDAYDNELINTDKRQTIEKIREYMNDMDRELSKTDIGKSFETTNVQQDKKSTVEPNNNDDDDNDDDDNDDDDDDDFKPVDIDLNVLKNIMESYKSEMGNPGPASALLSTIGIQMPNNADLH